MPQKIFIEQKYDTEEKPFLDYYHPFKGGNNPSFNQFSRLILDLKESKQSTINYFFSQLNPLLAQDFPIVIVPSSDPQNTHSGIRKLALLLSKERRIDGTSCLERYKQVAKKSTGGLRDINVEFNSIKVNHQDIIKGQSVLLLDDVTTTGTSLNACKQLLIQFGAARVVKFALAQTQSYT